MSDVIYGDFLAERAWGQAHQRLTDSILAIGAMFGDNNEELLRAKADCAHDTILRIVENVPAVDFTCDAPDDLPPEHYEFLKEALRAAALKGIETAVAHSVQVLTNSLHDLCTSKLSLQPSTHPPCFESQVPPFAFASAGDSPLLQRTSKHARSHSTTWVWNCRRGRR